MTTAEPTVPDAATASGLADAARAALVGVAPDGSVGPLVADATGDDHVHELAFACLMGGYVDWRWTVSIAVLPGEEPSVLEVELLPGADSLVAPAWVPWADRLADYRRSHPDEDLGADDVTDDDEDLDDDADDDADDLADDDLTDEEPADEDLAGQGLPDDELSDDEIADDDLIDDDAAHGPGGTPTA